ncbi:restriction endonuclease subunit S [Chryseobacterium sp. HMWF035]|uniref:restriction endonuclease subunit S n=1 Tax=Chryseobacterium sp. HMWF035 TaxID=2056868 RepID=UPI0014031A74|nr:restriction endonuclease subunit S [Chryseobacterium sp. HMWF035]
MTFFPNLRFPGFEGEWEEKILSDLGTFSGGGTPSSSNEKFWNGNIPWISSSDLEEDNIFKINISRFITQDAIEKSSTKLCKAPSVLIVSRVGVGKVALSFNDVCTSQDFTNISELKCNQLYLAFQLSKVMKKAANEVQGTSIKGISSSEIKSKKIYLPPIIEQEKISSFIEKIDKRIQTQKKIISQLKSQMSNLKDLIFEQKLRFKDSNRNIFSQWKYFKLSDLGNTFNGLSGKTKEHFGVGQKYIQYKQIFDSAKINIENCAFVDVEENENQNTVQYGDVFFTISSETPEEIGMSSVLLENVDNVYLNSFCFGFRATSFDKLIPEFSQFLFRSNTFRNEIIKLAQGSTRYNMSKTEFLKLNVKLPCKDEQTKIANFLSSIQEKIEIEKQILERLELQKKFLLANLFV